MPPDKAKKSKLENQDGELVEIVTIKNKLDIARLKQQIRHQQREKLKAIAAFDAEIARIQAIIDEAATLGIDTSVEPEPDGQP